MPRFDRLVRGAAAIGAAALLAGCSVMTPIQTAELYAAGDGVRAEVGDSGVRVENLMVLAEEEGAEGAVYGALVNDTTEELTIGVTIGVGGIELPVAAGESVLLGVDEEVVIPAVSVAPGGVVEATLRAEGHGAVPITVPVLDGTLPQYADLVP